jgi:hypothetical protein
LDLKIVEFIFSVLGIRTHGLDIAFMDSESLFLHTMQLRQGAKLDLNSESVDVVSGSDSEDDEARLEIRGVPASNPAGQGKYDHFSPVLEFTITSLRERAHYAYDAPLDGILPVEKKGAEFRRFLHQHFPDSAVFVFYNHTERNILRSLFGSGGIPDKYICVDFLNEVVRRVTTTPQRRASPQER